MNPTPLRPRHWRSLAEASQTKEFLDATAGEFVKPWEETLSRRGFLKTMGAAAALSGLSSCTREPIHQIVPYVQQPEQLVPGKPLHYATAMSLDGFGVGLLAESHEGHPTKIEGNPSHPASLGATGIFQQAALLDLYNPDRAQAVTNGGEVTSFATFLAGFESAVREQRTRDGAGLRILSHSITSPTLIAQIEELLRQFPEARWHQYQPLARDNSLEGAHQIFGQTLETRYRLDRANVVLALDADFLFMHPANLVHIRQFAQRRRPPAKIRLYAVEPTPSLTGAAAEHRLPVESSEVGTFAYGFAAELGIVKVSPPLSGAQRRWIRAIAQEFRKNPGASLIIPGETQPPFIHALCHLINSGQLVEYFNSAEKHWTNHRESLRELVKDMEAGAVECLMIFGGNPVFDSPADIPFAHSLATVKYSMHLHGERNETSSACQWHVPESHFLESWGDLRSFDGTVSIIQPLIMPLYESKTAIELLHIVNHAEIKDDYDLVRDYWQARQPAGDFEVWWRETLHQGWVAGSQMPSVQVRPEAVVPPMPSGFPAKESLEVCFRPDPCLWDGRFANNGWLQELPKPFSKMTWDNPALLSPALAKRLRLDTGDVIQLRVRGRSVTAPVWIMPGQAENSVTVHLGFGRQQAGAVGLDVGFSGYLLRESQSPWLEQDLEIVATGRKHLLATTQHSHNVQGREILHGDKRPPRGDTLYHPHAFDQTDYAWGMVIDLNSCVGCNACVLACQAENNIPVVGKEQVLAGRDMQWIRIDQYFEGAPDDPKIHHQPVPCMHCENAPCELVCPVGATLHDHQGLNLQVYNRCVGTRYCSNNCPYKVRRFNFFRYADYETPSLKSMRNPNVTVRWRGVMEKCTYCLQRISAARIASQLENRPIRDGEIKTACQQVCPAQAIVFGDIKNPNSAVSKLKGSPLNFSMLGELNTRPRTTYLERTVNPNAQLEGKS